MLCSIHENTVFYSTCLRMFTASSTMTHSSTLAVPMTSTVAASCDKATTCTWKAMASSSSAISSCSSAWCAAVANSRSKEQRQ